MIKKLNYTWLKHYTSSNNKVCKTNLHFCFIYLSVVINQSLHCSANAYVFFFCWIFSKPLIVAWKLITLVELGKVSWWGLKVSIETWCTDLSVLDFNVIVFRCSEDEDVVWNRMLKKTHRHSTVFLGFDVFSSEVSSTFCPRISFPMFCSATVIRTTFSLYSTENGGVWKFQLDARGPLFLLQCSLKLSLKKSWSFQQASSPCGPGNPANYENRRVHRLCSKSSDTSSKPGRSFI